MLALVLLGTAFTAAQAEAGVRGDSPDYDNPPVPPVTHDLGSSEAEVAAAGPPEPGASVEERKPLFSKSRAALRSLVSRIAVTFGGRHPDEALISAEPDGVKRTLPVAAPLPDDYLLPGSASGFGDAPLVALSPRERQLVPGFMSAERATRGLSVLVTYDSVDEKYGPAPGVDSRVSGPAYDGPIVTAKIKF